jgi:hypothetical protein
VIAFTLVIKIEPNHVIRKSIKVVELAAVVFAAFGSARYLELPSRSWLRIVGVGAVIAGFVTFCTDVFQYVDIENERKPEAAYISPPKMETLDWIRTHTPEFAIVQRVDEVRPGQMILPTGYVKNGEFDISVPALAERRTLYGNLKFQSLTHVADAPMDARRVILERVFTASDSAALRANLDQLPRSYLLLDRSTPGPAESVKQLEASGYLKEVFRAGDWSVLLMEGDRAHPGAKARDGTSH